MNKVFGSKEFYAPIRKDGNRTIISYGYNEEQNGATWYEIILYNKQYPNVTFDIVKNAILSDINKATDNKILSEFKWTALEGDDAGTEFNVWLSQENEFNFKAAYDIAVQTNGANLPVTFKLGEDTEGNPMYHTFTSMQESMDFYFKAVAFINLCLAEGWELKDDIDWSVYSNALTS